VKLEANRLLSKVNALPLLILVLTALFFSYNLGGVWINDDEGQYQYEAWRVRAGDIPYRDFMTAQMPLFLYTGGALQGVAESLGIAGAYGMALRMATVAAGVLATIALWRLGRRALGSTAAALALIPFAVNDSVYEVVRVYRSDPYMMLWSTVGLMLFVGALPADDGRASDTPARRRAFAWAGACFGLAASFKLFGVLTAGGCFLYLLIEAWRGKRTWRVFMGDALALGLPVAAILALTAIVFLALTPNFLERVVGHHLEQGSELGALGVLSKNLRFFAEYGGNQPIFLALAAAGSVALLRRRAGPRTLAILCQAPTLVAFLFLSRPLGDRHLVYAFPALALIWAGGLVAIAQTIRDRLRPSASGFRFPASVLWISLAALAAASFLPYIQRDLPRLLASEQDTPRLVALIEQASAPGTTMISDYQGLNYYTRRPGTYSSAGISTGAARSGQISAPRLIEEMEASDAQMVILEFGATSRRLNHMPDFDILYDYIQSHFALVASKPWAYPRGQQWLEIFSRTDTLPGRIAIPFENRLALTGYALTRDSAPVGSEVTATLRWQGLTTMPVGHSASLKLVDGEGNLWGQSDGEITATRYRARFFGPQIDPLHTDQWRPGQSALQELRVPIRPGVPPGEYQLALTVYETQSQRPLRQITSRSTLPRVRVTRPITPMASNALPIAQLLRGSWGPIDLIGSGPLPVTARPGDRLHLSLFWQAKEKPAADLRAQVSLRDGTGQEVSQATMPLAGADNPTMQWAAGEAWEGQYRLVTAPQIATGEYELAVTVVDAAGKEIEPMQKLTTVQIEGRQRLFDLPRPPQHAAAVTFGGLARLIGYDVATAADGQQVQVTLYWQALATADVSYTVFVHLLDGQGNVAAQRDAPPQDGAAPTTAWLADEMIVDTYTLNLPAGLDVAQTSLEVGLYDPATMARLPADGGGDAWRAPVARP
jgi:4-amino-4-deoxy-L-arabinose transferase-like glycosyltransferase